MNRFGEGNHQRLLQPPNHRVSLGWLGLRPLGTNVILWILPTLVLVIVSTDGVLTYWERF